MMNQIVNMVIRQVTRQIVRKGVGAAMKAGGDAMARRKNTGPAPTAAVAPESPAAQKPAPIEVKRPRHADERKGDEVLYPTDEFTEDMQPRR